jgi:CRP-like cAMP-binding protein
MPFSTNSPNHFLLSLSDTDRNLIFPHLKRVTVPRETIVFKAEDTIEQVYFPHSGIISLIVGLSTGQFVEAEMLGRNGVIGAGAALDERRKRIGVADCSEVAMSGDLDPLSQNLFGPSEEARSVLGSALLAFSSWASLHRASNTSQPPPVACLRR